MNVAPKRVFKMLGWTAVALLTAASAILGYVHVVSGSRMSQVYSVSVPQLSIPSDAASIARGKYLVESVSQCSACHGADLGGKTMHDDFAMGRIASANLTRGRGGIGANYTDEDFVRALMHGVRPDGRSVVFMPSADYAFTERDLANVIAYVKSVPPVDREHPTPAPGPLMRALSVFGDFPLSPAARIDHEHVRFAAPRDEDDPVAAGEQLVASAGCVACHGRDFAGGGGPPPGAGNITPVGISSWTEKDFITAIREHRRPNGTVISDTMPRGYGLMSDADLRRIFAFLRTLPPKGQLTGNQQ
jgi:mono/diheme cytochrome c family protein